MKIVIGTPNFTGQMEAEFAVTMARCIRDWSKEHEIHWLVLRRTFVCKARHMIVNGALQMGADYLFWVDDDAIINPELLNKLIAHDKDVVITPYPMRRPPYNCGVLTCGDKLEGVDEDKLDWESGWRNLEWKEMNQGLVEVDGGGTHAMLTRPKVYGPPKKQGETFEEYLKENPGQVPFPWFVLAPYGGTEDMYFCTKARIHRIKIFCDTDEEAGHVGYPQIITSGNGVSWQRKFGQATAEDVIKKQQAGLSYIDVEAAEDLEETRTTENIQDVSVAAENGSAPGT